MVSKETSRRAKTIEVDILACDKGKRKIVDRLEEKQNCKFREDPLVEKEALAIEVKRQQCDQ